jgi:hypothetical protein
VSTPDPTSRLLELLPVHLRTRDQETGGLLAALLAVVAGELDILDGDLDELYRSWFVETCPEWVVPYLADLVGVADLPPETVGASRRAFVANTIGYRRRKGTVAVIEQVARDASGWPARAVEFYRLLTVAAHLNHVRPDRPATASLRHAGGLDLVPPGVARGALDPLAHTGEVRHIAGGRGRYRIPHVGVFLFSEQIYDFPLAVADDDWPECLRDKDFPDPIGPDGSGWWVHPLGRPTPLFAPPTTEDTIEHLAVESDLPLPVRPRRLLELLRAARSDPGLVATVPVGVRIAGQTLAADRIRVRGLEDLAAVPGWQVMLDTGSGWLRTYLDGAPAAPDGVRVRHAYGAAADIGAGTFDRADIHDREFDEQGYVGDADPGRDTVRGQLLVRAGGEIADPAAALALAQARWAAPPPSAAGGTFVIAIGDSSRYTGDLAVAVPAQTRLVVVAATWRERIVGGEVLPRVVGDYGPAGLRPVVVGDLRITGGPGAAVILDGLVITGEVIVEPGDLGWLTVSHCTVAGGVRVAATADDGNANCRIRVVRSVLRRVALAPTVPAVALLDSIVDDTGGAVAVAAPGAAVGIDGSTVLGSVTARTLSAGSSLLDGQVLVAHRQVGCVRYSYVGPGSRVPRRFACVPAAEGGVAQPPVYRSTEPGSPVYLVLAAGGPAAYAGGAEGDGEMGAYHHRQARLRVEATRRLLDPYVPVGLEIGIVGS